jgi:hypothetical protein
VTRYDLFVTLVKMQERAVVESKVPLDSSEAGDEFPPVSRSRVAGNTGSRPGRNGMGDSRPECEKPNSHVDISGRPLSEQRERILVPGHNRLLDSKQPLFRFARYLAGNFRAAWNHDDVMPAAIGHGRREKISALRSRIGKQGTGPSHDNRRGPCPA